MIIDQESDNMKNLNLRITIRLEQKQRKQIDKAISEGRGKSISDLMRAALVEFLKSE
jgi:Arc/MetJ-type ribon-helix-helix transcriptional regulator